MAKLSTNTRKNNASENGVTNTNTGVKAKAVKRTRRSVPRDSPPQRSSIYRGVTRHRWTGRYEAHLWDKNCWNESQNKKGRQVYLGAYDDEEAAAHAYDLAALKYWGQDTILNFPLSTYEKEVNEMGSQSREEYIGSLRRKSSGFSRGVSKYRGVARHHHNGRWEARIGRVFGNKYLYLGTYATQEEAATAYDMAAIEYRGLNAVTNFDLSRYIKWLRPNTTTAAAPAAATNNLIQPNPNIPNPNIIPNLNHDLALTFLSTTTTTTTKTTQQLSSSSSTSDTTPQQPPRQGSALGLLLQSSKFKEMMEMTLAADDDNIGDNISSSSPLSSSTTTPTFETEIAHHLQQHQQQQQSRCCSFPDDIQTYFACQDQDSAGSYGEVDDFIFGDLNALVSESMFECDFDEEIKQMSVS